MNIVMRSWVEVSRAKWIWRKMTIKNCIHNTRELIELSSASLGDSFYSLLSMFYVQPKATNLRSLFTEYNKMLLSRVNNFNITNGQVKPNIWAVQQAHIMGRFGCKKMKTLQKRNLVSMINRPQTTLFAKAQSWYICSNLHYQRFQSFLTYA